MLNVYNPGGCALLHYKCTLAYFATQMYIFTLWGRFVYRTGWKLLSSAFISRMIHTSLHLCFAHTSSLFSVSTLRLIIYFEVFLYALDTPVCCWCPGTVRLLLATSHARGSNISLPTCSLVPE